MQFNIESDINLKFVFSLGHCFFWMEGRFYPIKVMRISHSLKEACYSWVPVGISCQINDFPIPTALEICSISCRRQAWDEIPTIWDRLRTRMLRSHKNNCISSPLIRGHLFKTMEMSWPLTWIQPLWKATVRSLFLRNGFWQISPQRDVVASLRKTDYTQTSQFLTGTRIYWFWIGTSTGTSRVLT